MLQGSGLWRMAASVVGGAVLMAGAAVTLAALPASGDAGGPAERRLVLEAGAQTTGRSTFAARVEQRLGGAWVPVAGEVVTFAFVGEGAMQVGDGSGGAQCTTGAEGACIATVSPSGAEPSLLLATSGGLSADVSVP